VLKAGGRLVFAEMFPDPDRLSVQELRDLAEPEDFEFVLATETGCRTSSHSAKRALAELRRYG
jgi:hypothetical protein